ncbi:MAG: hypothetical protein ACFCUW_14200 [Kiloniellaceae bacterium]
MADDWIPQIVATLAGVGVGGLVTYGVLRKLEGERRVREREELVVTLYHEVADRAARCLNDYLVPWQKYERGLPPDETMNGARAGKFRPTDPVVYPLVAGRLGTAGREVIGPVVQFYFALDAVRREVDGVVADYPDLDVLPEDRARLVALRLRQTLNPALRCLKILGVSDWRSIDSLAVVPYPHITQNYSELREGLRDKRPS